MSNLLEFTVTDDHLKLLRRMCVRWDDCEAGAPAIDPKRPYGNSDVEKDVAEILGWELKGADADDDDAPCLSAKQYRKAIELHAETEYALQIVLRSGEFITGTWTRENSWSDWVREAQAPLERDFVVPNLDDISHDDLRDYNVLFRQLVAYTQHGLNARLARQMGHVQDAQVWESQMEGVYNELPEQHRW